MANSCEFPYLLKGNLVGVTAPIEGDAIAINLGQQIEIWDETSGADIYYPKWHPLAGRDDLYDQDVCRKICERTNSFKALQVGLRECACYGQGCVSGSGSGPLGQPLPHSWVGELQYNPEITVLKGLANLDLYWRELLLVGDHYSMISLQKIFTKNSYNVFISLES